MSKNKDPGCADAGCKCFFPLAASFIVGILAFAGGSAALSATDGAEFCASCHVMSEASWTHSKSVHAKQACNECHLPHDGAVGMLVFKAKLGLSDITVNTLSKAPDSIMAAQDMKDVIQQNCVRCHYSTVREVNMTVKPYCTDCHRSVPHMNKIPIDRRRAADV